MANQTNGFKQWIEACKIFDEYLPDKSFVFGAEHDIVYIYVEPDTVSAEHKSQLEALGFDVDEDLECFSCFV